MLAQLHDPLQEFKHVFEDPLFVVKVRSYIIIIIIIIIALTSLGALLAESDRIDEQLGNAREGVYKFSVPEIMSLCRYIATY